MRKRREKRDIKHLVHSILVVDKRARDDDRYLYLKVVEKLNPTALTRPFALAVMDDVMPCRETVRRSRQWVQAHFPELQSSDKVSALRLLEEEDYREFVKHG